MSTTVRHVSSITRPYTPHTRLDPSRRANIQTSNVLSPSPLPCRRLLLYSLRCWDILQCNRCGRCMFACVKARSRVKPSMGQYEWNRRRHWIRGRVHIPRAYTQVRCRAELTPAGMRVLAIPYTLKHWFVMCTGERAGSREGV